MFNSQLKKNFKYFTFEGLLFKDDKPVVAVEKTTDHLMLNLTTLPKVKEN